MKTKITMLIMVMFLAIVFTGAASATDTGNNSTNTSWSQYQYDNSHTGQSNSVGPQTNTTKWYTTGNPNSITQNSNLAIGSDGTIYYGIRNDNHFYAMYPNGTPKWQVPTSKSIFGVAVGSDGTIYAGTSSGSAPYLLYAFNQNGTTKWIYTFSSTARNIRGVTVVNNTIYTESDEGTFYALTDNGDHATQLWKYTTGARVDVAPAIGSDGTIYFGDYNGVIHALNPNGSQKWNYTIGGQIQSGVSISSNGTLYVGSTVSSMTGKGGGYLYALTDNGDHATQLWNYTTGYITWSTAAISKDGTIYVGNNNGGTTNGVLYALNPNGSQKWNYTIYGTLYYGGGITDSPVIGADGTIYFGSNDGNIYALNPNGTVKWKYYVGSTIYNLAINNATLYVANYGTKPLYAFEDPAPVANFTVTPNTGDSPLTVQFNDTSINTPTSWIWDFGDGSNTSTEQNPTHTYTKPGTYTVTLTTSNAAGSSTQTSTITAIDVTAPIVNATPIGGLFNTTQSVTLTTTDDSGSAITYYTTDGTDPTTSSTRTTYNGPIAINGTTTLLFAAVDAAGNWSPVYNQTYQIKSDVYVNITPSNSNPQVGDTVTYTFKVGNNGPGIAKNVTFTYTIPEGLEYAGATVDQGTVTYNPTTRTLTWNLGDVAVGDPKLWLNLKVLSAGNYNIQPTVTVGGSTLESNINSLKVNAASATTTDPETVNAATTTQTIPMKTTGMPITALISALLLIGSGLTINRKK